MGQPDDVRARLAVLALLATVATSPTVGALSVELAVPEPVPTDGTPFDARIAIEDAERSTVELKVWLGGEDWQASRTFNGSAFQRSDLYVRRADTSNGSWTGWVPLRANPDSSNAARLQAQDGATVGARVRAAGTTETSRRQVDLLHDPERRPVQLGPDGSVRALDEGLVAHRSNPTDEPTVTELALPAGFDGRVCIADRSCRSGGELVLDRVNASSVRVRNTGARALDLSTGVVLLEEGSCGLTGRLEPNATRTFTLAEPDEGTAAARDRSSATTTGDPASCAGQGPTASAPPRTLWWRAETIDHAPDPPGWGDVVREPWGQHRWAEWRLPAGVEPRPFRMRPVEGQVTAFGTEDQGLERVLDVIEGARRRLTVSTYLFTNRIVADALEGAADRGVDVTLILEPTPVGGLPSREEGIVDRLEQAGVEVRFFAGPVAEHGLQHAKIVVADGTVLLVLTENLTMSGLPPDGDGNVGLGVGVANASIASRVEALFGEDGPDRAWTPDGWRSFEGAIGLLTSPENAWRRDAVPAWLSRAGRVDGLILRADPSWGPRDNAWLSGLVEASRDRPVRVLATGVPDQARPDNRRALSYLLGHPDSGHLEARLAPPGLGTLHAKSLIGAETALVGSTNWGLGGVLLNREVNLLVQDRWVAQRLGSVFDRAWNGTGSSGGFGDARAMRDIPSVGASLSPPVLMSAALLVSRNRRRIRRSGRSAREQAR